ncbi:20934_t:CDS:1, partial [Cetraspora pellucida]
MSDEDDLPSVYNNRLLNNQVVNAHKRANNDDSLNFLNSIINELCELYNNEVMKGNSAPSILNSIDHFIENKQQTSEEIINLCLKNQGNP